MRYLTRYINHNLRNSIDKRQLRCLTTTSPSWTATNATEDEDFRVLNLRKLQGKQTVRREYKKPDVLPPRALKMPVDQDWTAVWPGPRSFHPAVVPLPLRQGFTEKGAPPAKYANAELMKIPNFLHLTPLAIKRQCEALKKFCTTWPKGLETEEKWKRYFPLDIVYTDYCQALPTIRNPAARKITLRIKLSELKFTTRAKDKFLRLVKDRYNLETDVLTIIADRCPLRRQNYNYALYLLTACYHEAFVKEDWEDTKSEADMEYYSYERNKCKTSTEAILNWPSDQNATETAASRSATDGFIESVERLVNEGENEYNLNKYKEEVKKMLSIGK